MVWLCLFVQISLIWSELNVFSIKPLVNLTGLLNIDFEESARCFMITIFCFLLVCCLLLIVILGTFFFSSSVRDENCSQSCKDESWPQLKEHTITLSPPHKDKSSPESAKTPKFKIRPSKTEEEQLLVLPLFSDPTNSAITGWLSGLGVASSWLISPCSDCSRTLWNLSSRSRLIPVFIQDGVQLGVTFAAISTMPAASSPISAELSPIPAALSRSLRRSAAARSPIVAWLAKHHKTLSNIVKHREPLVKHHEPLVKHHETLLEHCETSWNTQTLIIRCDIDARCRDVGARRGDIGDRAELPAISARSLRLYQCWCNSADV